MDAPYDAVVIREVVEFLRNQLDYEARGEGCSCCVCGKRAKWYRRSLNKTLVQGLINLYKFTLPGEPAHIADFAGTQFQAADFAKTRYWWLTEASSKEHGWWKLTDFGRSFVEGKQRIYKYAWVYRARAMEYAGPPVSIHDCYGQHFDIREVLVPRVYR